MSISSFVHLTSVIAGIKEVKHSTKTATSDSKSEDLRDDPICIIKTPNKIFDSLKERMEILPLNQVIWIIHQIQRAGIKYTIRLKSYNRVIRKNNFWSELGK